MLHSWHQQAAAGRGSHKRQQYIPLIVATRRPSPASLLLFQLLAQWYIFHPVLALVFFWPFWVFSQLQVKQRNWPESIWVERGEKGNKKLSLGRPILWLLAQYLQLSWFLWNQALKLCSQSLWTSWRSSGCCFLYFPHAVTSSCVINWIGEVMWLKTNPTGKVVLLGVEKHRKGGTGSIAL